MNRRMTMAAAGGALVAMILSNVLGASAAGPYVYGCTALTWDVQNAASNASVTIYNGGSTTANLTHKLLAGDGTQLGAAFMVPSTSSLLPTKTVDFHWVNPTGDPNITNNTIPTTVRIVSDVPVAVGVQINGNVGVSVPCTLLSPTL
jgi:hypothetical protein